MQVSFPSLTRLTSTVKSLLHLKTLHIYDCGLMEEIIFTEEIEEEEEEEEESIHKIVFFNLDILHLEMLPNLNRFSNGYLIEFQSLREMKIKACDALKKLVGSSSDNQSLFNEMVTFSNLQIMNVSCMWKLEHVWHTNQLAADSFCKLKSLTIVRCWKLLAVFSSNVIRRFQRLEDLNIYDCDKIEEIYQLGGLNSIEVVAFELRHLDISGMPSLKRIWSSEDGNGVFSFQNLKSVHVFSCDELEYIFLESIACGLLQLEELQIFTCGVEHIVGKGKSIKSDPKAPHNFNFPELTSFRLEGLRKLRSFYEGSHTLEWPKLKDFEVVGCAGPKISNRDGQQVIPIPLSLLVLEKVKKIEQP